MRLQDSLSELDRKVLGSSVFARAQDGPGRRTPPMRASVLLGAALAIASWIILALWPPMSAPPLVGAAIAAALACGVLARRRLFVWLLLTFIALKAAGDGAEFTDGFIAVPLLMVATDVAAFVLLALPRSRAWARQVVPTLQDQYAYATQRVTGQFVIDWAPSEAEWERVFRAQQWIDRRMWLRWAVAGLVVTTFAFAAAGGDRLSFVFLVFGVVWGVGVWDYAARRINIARRRSSLLEHETISITPDELVARTEIAKYESQWSRWPACLVLPDFIILLTGTKGRHVQAFPLAKRGLTGGAEWEDCVRLVLSRVPPHPRADRVLHRIPI